jgi:tetratricopeptide (TPR) repeat protein
MMRRRCRAILDDRRLLGPGLALTAMLTVAATLAGCGSAGISHGADEQLKFGVRMAQRGLWSEALFRFERAREMSPGNSRVLNNLAVAQEASGRYDEALETYREALWLSPGHSGLAENYARFVEFYESFRPEDEPGAAPVETAAEQEVPP